MCSIIVIRLICYVILRGFGISFWIFPEMMDDRYWPLFSFEFVSNLNALEIIFRIILIIFVSYVGYRFYQEPETFCNLL